MMMTMSYANNNNNASQLLGKPCHGGMNVLECELGDIYAAPEIMHNSDVLTEAKQKKCMKQSNNSSNNSNECSSTDCSSNSDEDFEDFQTIVSKCSAKSFLASMNESNLSLSPSASSECAESAAAVNNNSCVRKYKCLKPSLFNPERENILAQQSISAELEDVPSLERRISYLFDKVYENYYKIALMNCALKFTYPEELLLHLQKKSACLNVRQSKTQSVFEEDNLDYLADGEEEDINGLSEEELLQDLYSAPEIL